MLNIVKQRPNNIYMTLECNFRWHKNSILKRKRNAEENQMRFNRKYNCRLLLYPQFLKKMGEFYAKPTFIQKIFYFLRASQASICGSNLKLSASGISLQRGILRIWSFYKIFETFSAPKFQSIQAYFLESNSAENFVKYSKTRILY